MRRTGNLKKFVSGFMAGMTLLSSILSPMSVYAAETVMEEQPPLYEEVKDQLDEDEVVKAEDYEIAVGSNFDVKIDFSGLEIRDNNKVKVTFEEAKNADGMDFSIDHADSYKAVYYVEPSNTEHPRYQISRNLIVKEAETESIPAEERASDDQSVEEETEEESDSQQDVITDTEESENDTVGTEGSSDMETMETEETTPEAPVEIETDTETEGENASDVNTNEETDVISESESEDEAETEIVETEESETEESETEEDGRYQVTVTKGSEFNISLNHEDGRYEAGEQVTFSADMPDGCLVAVAALKENANKEKQTADILYSEVSCVSGNDTFSFEMPADNIALEVAVDQQISGNSIMLLAAEDDPWDEATEIEANTYYYYSDGKLHPFNSVMGSGGNDSYKYVRYKVNGKTYTVNAYCMQHSMPSPPSGTTYKNMIELDEGGDDKYLRKAFFYGYGGPGWGDTFNGHNIQQIMKNAGCTTETRAMQHYLVDYLYDGESGFGGALSDTAKNMLKDIKAALADMPDPTAMKLLPGLSVTASGTDTETFTWKANAAFTITIHLEDGVSLVNETTGKTSTGNVTVKGGDKFHLRATTSDVSKLGGKYKITSNYPLDFHAMLLKLQSSQDIGFGYFTDSSNLELLIDWPELATVEIVKKDAVTGKSLAGAVYGIYSDEAGSKLLATMPATDKNGKSSIMLEKTQDTVYLKEISVPTGYVLDAKSYGINLIVGGTTKKEVTDIEQRAELTVYKEGEVLTGANVTDSGVTFSYSDQKLPGAVFNVYAGADIKAADGTVVYQKGALVKEGLATEADGSAILSDLHLGTYVVTETKAPDDYICTGESKTVTLSYAGQTEKVVFGSVSFMNQRQKAGVTVVKKDNQTDHPLAGGIYGLYASDDILNVSGNVVVKKDTLIEKATTGTDGKAVYQADLPVNYSYYVKELQAPKGYFRNSDDVFVFDFNYTNDKESVVSFAHTFKNERVDAAIHLVKKDIETGRTVQGDASFEGAVYGLYAREDIVHPDGKTGVLHKAGNQITTLTTDKNGDASVQGLYLGKYFIKEITPPIGYLIDKNEYDLECSYDGDLVKTVERTVESGEQVMKQPFQIIKVSNDGKTDAELLKGAGFTAYLESSLKRSEDGSYDFSSANPVILTADGKTEMFTDEKGYVCSIPLPYGTYIVRETTTPHNYTPVDDFKVVISENHPDQPQIWRILLDDEFKAKLKIVKKDDETKQTVLVAGTEFKIYDVDHKKYVEQVTTYPVTKVHKSYFTDNHGYLILPNSLEIGYYRVEEVTPPDGYTLNQNYVEITVDSNTAYKMDPVSGDAVIEVEYENHPVKGKLIVYKKGEMLADFKKDFIYEEKYLKGAEFEVYAAEDVYTPDYQKDENGNRTLVYAKDTLVTTIATGEDGKAVAENLPLGAYRVAEKTAPDGFVRNPDDAEVVFLYEGQETPVIEQEITVGNERQRVEITVEKQDAENGAVVEGAVFGIYNKEDIEADGEVIVKADTLLQEMTSGEDGIAVCTLDLPLGKYCVRELKAPAGFVSSDEVLEFDASYQGQDVKTVVLKSVKKNEPTSIEFTKSDLTTGTELEGASLKVLDKDGNIVDEWTSVKDAPHVIKRLTVGETYTLREEFAPYGYLKATDVEFTVEDTAEIQKVEMKDEVPTGLLIINKKGEFLDKITLLDSAKGTVEHLFEYLSGNLQEVTFEVFAAEDIKSADGISEDYFKADDLVGTITTDSNGIAQLGDLPVGKYYVKEVETAHGYVLDGEPRYVDLSYRDQNTPVVTFDEKWQNNRQKVKVSVLKKEKDTERVLAGGVFGLFTRESINNASGDVLMEADTMIEQKSTDENGQIIFTADLPVDGKYYVKEMFAPDGFVTDNEEQDFTFEYAGADQAEASYEFLFENEATNVELKKTDLTTGEELPGAHLKVTDEDGNVVDEWISTTEPHVIKELVVGKNYTMTETKPADGYVTAEEITFTVENTAEMQKHEMKDDVTKVEISKTDITGDQEVPGAKLTVLDANDQVVDHWISTDKPHYVEKLPIGRYTLREEQAPKGYVLTSDITFEVQDIGEIQKVTMKDDTAKGKVILNKTDKASGEPIKGVEFELRDKKGKVLETLKTDAAGHAESRLYEIAAYKNGKYSGEKKYYLVETKTLEGYTLDKTEHEVIFKYENDSTPIVEVTFDLKNERTEIPDNPETSSGTPEERTTHSESPKTGDTTNLWLPILLMAVSVSGIAGLAVARRKKKSK